MVKVLTSVLLTIAITATTSPAFSDHQNANVQENTVNTTEDYFSPEELQGETRVIVGYENNLSEKEKKQTLEENLDAEFTSTEIGDDATVAQLESGVTAEEIESLLNDPRVAYVEPDLPVHPLSPQWDPEIQKNENWGDKGSRGDGPFSSEPHGANAVGSWLQGATGTRDVYVGVIDSGIDINHPELSSQIWVNQREVAGNKIDDDGNGYVDDVNGWNVPDKNGDVAAVSARDRHGTLIAGKISAQGANGIGSTGISWNTGIIPARIFTDKNNFSAYTSDVVGAINYLVKLKTHNKVNLVAINASLGGGGYSTAERNAIRAAGDAGILFVAAAGNNGLNNDTTPTFPSSYDCATATRNWNCIVSVAAHNRNGQLVSWSNYGPTSVNISAPGEQVLTTQPYTTTTTLESGTSLSAPHVTGAIALCASVNPSLSAEQIRTILLNTAKPTSQLAGKVSTGGQLDVGVMTRQCANTNEATLGAIETLSVTRAQRTRIEGWMLNHAGGTPPRFSVDGRNIQPAIISQTETPQRTQFVVDLQLQSGVRQICLTARTQQNQTVNLDCTQLLVIFEGPLIGGIQPAPKTNGRWQLNGWVLNTENPNSTPEIALYVENQILDPKLGVRTTEAAFPRQTYVGWGWHNKEYSFDWQTPAGTHNACVVASLHSPTRIYKNLGCFQHKQFTSNNPIGSLESVTRTNNASATIQGWALDPDEDQPSELHVYVNGRFAAARTTHVTRTDIVSTHPGYTNTIGYDTRIPIDPAATTNQVCVYAINKGAGDTNPLLGCRTVTNRGGPPIGAFDVARQHGPRTIRVAGWALDPNTVDPIPVHVYVNGVGSAHTADFPRPGTDTTHPGYGDLHGYRLNVTAGVRAGANQVCVYAINVGNGNTNPLLGCRTVTILSGNPIGNFETTQRINTNQVRVIGWTLDPDTIDPIPVHVYVGARGTAHTANTTRGDIGSAYPGYGSNHGYNIIVNARAGETVCVYAINRGAGTTNPLLGCRRT